MNNSEAKKSYETFVTENFTAETIVFLRQYLDFNIDSRHKLLFHLVSVYEGLLSKKQTKQNVALEKMLCLEAITKIMMTIEEFAVFCIAFNGDLKDLPSKVVGYKPREVYDFYDKLEEKPDAYFQKLWDYPDANKFNCSLEEQILLDKVIHNNTIYLKQLLLLVKEFKEKHDKVYNKYKHSLAILTDFDMVAHGTPPEGFDVIAVCVDKQSPLKHVQGILVGRTPFDRYLRLQFELTDILKDLIKRRLYKLDFKGDIFPPYELHFQREEMYTDKELEDYKKLTERLTPMARECFELKFWGNSIHLKNDIDWFMNQNWKPIYNTANTKEFVSLTEHVKFNVKNFLTSSYGDEISDIQLAEVLAPEFTHWKIRVEAKISQEYYSFYLEYDVDKGEYNLPADMPQPKNAQPKSL